MNQKIKFHQEKKGVQQLDVVIEEKKMTRQEGNDNLQKCVARHNGKGAKKLKRWEQQQKPGSKVEWRKKSTNVTKEFPQVAAVP